MESDLDLGNKWKFGANRLNYQSIGSAFLLSDEFKTEKMEIIVFEKESFYKMIDELTIRIARNVERRYTEKEWINETEAKTLLGIKSRTKLRELRDELMIEFSQFGKIIRYSRSSILRFLEERRVRL